jgi:hypothetical protein
MAISESPLTPKERARNNLNNYGAGFLVLAKRSQEAHSCSTQRLRSFRQNQKDQPECSSYFVHVPKYKKTIVCVKKYFDRTKSNAEERVLLIGEH